MRIGNLELHDLEMLSPLRPHTPVSLATVEFMDRLAISVHADTRVIPPDDAAELLADYLAAVAEFAESSQ
jgi:hypothetical protein